jgi:hypothetical protein
MRPPRIELGFIAAHEIVCLSFQAAFQVPVVCRVIGNDREGEVARRKERKVGKVFQEIKNLLLRPAVSLLIFG